MSFPCLIMALLICHVSLIDSDDCSNESEIFTILADGSGIWYFRFFLRNPHLTVLIKVPQRFLIFVN